MGWGNKMSADTMIICKEDDSSYKGKGKEKAFCIGETSMGDPHEKFNQWFQERFSGHPSMIEQMAGIKEHNYIKLTTEDTKSIKESFDKLGHKDYIDKKEFFEWLDEHNEKHISTENW